MAFGPEMTSTSHSSNSDKVGNQKELVHHVLFYLQTLVLLQVLPVCKLWRDSVNAETWKSSCRKRKALESLKKATGMNRKFLAAGLAHLETKEQSLRPQDLFLLLEITDTLTLESTPVRSGIQCSSS